MEVRIHLNPDEGTLWWAEGGEFVGGAEKLHVLVAKIEDWAESENQEVGIRLMGDVPSPRPVDSLGKPPQATTRGDEALPISVNRRLTVGA